MKILIVSYFFPPYNCIGAVRVGKAAKYLTKLGHDVRVISANNQLLPKKLQLEILSNQVYYTHWLNINYIPKKILDVKANVIQKDNIDYKYNNIQSGVLKKLAKTYQSIFNFPDAQIGWYPFAFQAARQILKTWSPDIIYASAMPFTSLLVAKKIHDYSQIPWVAEFRDLWTDGHNYDYPAYRKFIEEKLEARIIKSSYGIVTVSEPLAKILRDKYNKKTHVVFNGFDPNDFPAYRDSHSCNLTVVYTGIIYPDKQEIKPFFDSIQWIRDRSLKVEFYGRGLSSLESFIQSESAKEIISINQPIAYRESLKKQYNADILLIFLWKNVNIKGILSGKIFEYIGAGRPILAIGNSEDSAAQLIKSKNLGVVMSEPKMIAAQLDLWAEQKRRNGYISSPNCEEKYDFTRLRQTQKLNDFLTEILDQHN